MQLEKLKVFLWTVLNMPKYRIKFWQKRLERKKLSILDSESTINQIKETHCSVSRYGDGELQMIAHYKMGGTRENFPVDTFQEYNPHLAERLLEILKSKEVHVLVCLPYQFKDSSISKLGARVFWEREYLGKREILKEINQGQLFGDTNFTRFYLDRKDIKDYSKYIDNLKSIWKDRKLMLIEGEFSRLGVGNDIFDSAKQIQRIICPSTNAFQKYDEIFEFARNQDKETLFLIALGHTATILANDLAKQGFQALDIGHIDIEYEWFKRKAKNKIAVPNKYVNEVKEGRIMNQIFDEKYVSEIIHQI